MDYKLTELIKGFLEGKKSSELELRTLEKINGEDLVSALKHYFKKPDPYQMKIRFPEKYLQRDINFQD